MINQPFRTPVILKKDSQSLNHSRPILTFGSCFSANIGQKLVQSGFDVQINPFGVLYNPGSIANAIGRIVENKSYTVDELMQHHDLWLSLDHHGVYSKSTQAATLEGINNEISKAHLQLQQNSLLIITLGSAHVYRYKETGRIAGNCHKLPSRDFVKEMLTVDEVVTVMSGCLKRLTEHNPSSRIIFTISPVRYLSDGFFENQLSKSILHLSVAELQKKFSQVSYFPAYEIMMDDLRDYRFYADDMLHPSSLAVDYIWEQFRNSYFGNETKVVADEIRELHKALSHHPFQQESITYRLFLQNQIKKINQLQSRTPQVTLDGLKQQFEMKIKAFE